MILSLDPSSKCTGYAWHERSGDFVEAGRLTPSVARADLVASMGAAGGHWRSGVRDGWIRAMSMAEQVGEMLWEHPGGPSVVVTEVPSGKAGTSSRVQRSGGGLGTLGAVQGMVFQALWSELNQPQMGGRLVIPVDERLWTREMRCTKKAGRPARVEAMVPRYDPADDPGCDVADAILIGRWWLQKMKEHG